MILKDSGSLKDPIRVLQGLGGWWLMGFRGFAGQFRVWGLGFQGRFGFAGPGALIGCYTHRPLSSSFLGLPYRILHINHKKELLWGLWVRHVWGRRSGLKGRFGFNIEGSVGEIL